MTKNDEQKLDTQEVSTTDHQDDVLNNQNADNHDARERLRSTKAQQQESDAKQKFEKEFKSKNNTNNKSAHSSVEYEDTNQKEEDIKLKQDTVRIKKPRASWWRSVVDAINFIFSFGEQDITSEFARNVADELSTAEEERRRKKLLKELSAQKNKEKRVSMLHAFNFLNSNNRSMQILNNISVRNLSRIAVTAQEANNTNAVNNASITSTRNINTHSSIVTPAILHANNIHVQNSNKSNISRSPSLSLAHTHNIVNGQNNSERDARQLDKGANINSLNKNSGVLGELRLLNPNTTQQFINTPIIGNTDKQNAISIVMGMIKSIALEAREIAVSTYNKMADVVHHYTRDTTTEKIPLQQSTFTHPSSNVSHPHQRRLIALLEIVVAIQSHDIHNHPLRENGSRLQMQDARAQAVFTDRNLGHDMGRETFLQL